MEKYIKQYGDKTFDELPFGDVDSLLFSQLAYTDYDGIVSYNTSVSLRDAANEFAVLYSQEKIDSLLGISQKSAQLLFLCSETKRYGDTILCHYVNNIIDEIDKQFSAISFILNDGSFLTAFRGTDATVTGAKESAMLSYMFPVPAQIESLHYFQESAMRHDGAIRIAGHSKGGNLAVYAGINCSNSLKKRIVGIYEYDAPGFPKWFFDRYDYLQIKDRIHLFTPQSSIIGRMLHHDTKPQIVVSTNSGLKQHQVSSWQIAGTSFVTTDSYDARSDFLAQYINNLIDYVGDDDLEVFFNTLETLADGLGIEDFYDIKDLDLKRALGLIDTVSNLDEEQKEKFKQIIKKASTDFAKEYLNDKMGFLTAIKKNNPFSGNKR